MRTLEISVRIGLAVLLVTGLALAETRAQPLRAAPEGGIILAQGAVSASQEAELVGLLGNSLQSLSDQSRRGRHIGGYILLGIGAGLGVGGVAALTLGDSDDSRVAGYSLIGGGLLLGGISLLPFMIHGETERMYREFKDMPDGTSDQVHRKYVYWDRRFEELAGKRRRDRYIGGISSILTGATGYYMVDDSNESRLHAFIWPAFAGVSTILVKSEEERRYDSYRRAKEDMLARLGNPEIRFAFAPLPKGGTLGTVQIRF
jgi:hypothetical protein